jgi:small subunit ribosomal protein S8
MPASKAKEAIAKVLQDEGYITGFATDGEGATKELTVELKYFEGVPVIEKIQRASRPGAYLPGQGRLAKGIGRPRCCNRFNVCGRNERSPGARERYWW